MWGTPRIVSICCFYLCTGQNTSKRVHSHTLTSPLYHSPSLSFPYFPLCLSCPHQSHFSPRSAAAVLLSGLRALKRCRHPRSQCVAYKHSLHDQTGPFILAPVKYSTSTQYLGYTAMGETKAPFPAYWKL